MGEGTPSPLGTEHAGNRDFIRVAEKIAGLAFQLLGGHHAHVYRLDGTTFGRVASAGPDAPTETTAASADADVAWSRLLSPADPARGTVDVLAESACRLD